MGLESLRTTGTQAELISKADDDAGRRRYIGGALMPVAGEVLSAMIEPSDCVGSWSTATA